MEESKIRLLSKISDYLRARVWLRDYTVARNSPGSIQTGMLNTGGQSEQEMLCSLSAGSIAPMDRLLSY